MGQLQEKASPRTGLLALKMAYVEEVPPRVLDPITGGAIADTEWERHILRYITECLRLTPAMPKASLRRTRPDRWETLMETVAETWKREARMEGRMEGHAQAVLRMLELRFGALPARAREQVRNGSAEELDAWTEAVLTAKSLEEVLDAQAGHH